MSTIKINEAQLMGIINESVNRVLAESEVDEGFFKNMMSGIKGAGMGYNTQKFFDSDINTDYGNANTNFNAMIQGVKTKEDAAKVYSKMIQIARNYESQASQLMAKMKEVYAQNGVERKQNRQGGKFASGFQNNDTATIDGGNAFGGLQQKADTMRQNILNRRAQQRKAMSNGMAASGTMPVESKNRNANVLTEERINQIVSESIYKVLNESELDEGFWDNMKAAGKGFVNGFRTQNNLDRNMSRYQNDAQARQTSLMRGGNAVDNLANKIYYKDAKTSGEKMYAMAKEYQAKAQQIRQMAKELAQKWGVTKISKVGQAGPVQYGYSGRPIYKPSPEAN